MDYLVCPRDRAALVQTGERLTCQHGHSYPIYGGIPIFVLSEEVQTFSEANRALDPKEIAYELTHDDGQTPPPNEVHPLVKAIMPATSGLMFRGVSHRMTRYPILHLRVEDGPGKRFLDIGCNWGRWSIAAAQKGYKVVGIAPSFGALVVARRVCRPLGLEADFVCADARHLPFPDGHFDVAYSYSVVQHFSKNNARIALTEVGQVLKKNGVSLIQMPNKYGFRNLYYRLRFLFRSEQVFDVRYWSIKELVQAFREAIGPSSLSIDGFFGLGIQAGGSEELRARHRMIIGISETLRRHKWLLPVADCLFVRLVKQ